jgi:lysozyme
VLLRSSWLKRHFRCAVVVSGVLIAAGAAAALAWVGVRSGHLRLNYPSWDRFPVRGIDVSNHQKSVDFARVRQDGYSFAYIKATEGGDWVDPYYAELSANARRAGLRVGSYHYFSFCRPGADQGRNFVTVTGGPRRGDLPPAVDLEFGGACRRVPTHAELDREFAAFVAVLRRNGYPAPVMYMTGSFASRYLNDAGTRSSPLAGHRLWARNIIGEPSDLGGTWTFWQYSNGGRVDGVSGLVDLNAYAGDAHSFAREFS